jgi:hypothetical protein
MRTSIAHADRGLVSVSGRGVLAVELDFAGVRVVAPSWLDEVLTSLREAYGNRVRCLPSANASLAQSLKTLDAVPDESTA